MRAWRSRAAGRPSTRKPYASAAAALVGTALALGSVAAPALAGGEEFWGRTLADQPTNFVVGYGSLINTASRASTAGRPVAAIPVRVGAAFGYVRCLCDRSLWGFTALGLRRPAPGEAAATINGVLYPADGGDMAQGDGGKPGTEDRDHLGGGQVAVGAGTKRREHGRTPAGFAPAVGE